jgi:hypothetical protein
MTWRSSPNRRKLVAIGTQNAVGAQIRVGDTYKIVPNGSALGTLKRLINSGGPVSEAMRAIQERLALGTYRESPQAGNWAGHVVAEVLGLDLGSKAAKKRVKTLLDTWVSDGLLLVVEGMDGRSEVRKFIATGRSVDAPWPLSQPITQPSAPPQN